VAKKKIVSIALDSEIDQEAEFMAKSEGITKSILYRRAINDYLDKKREEKIIESKKRLEEIEKNYK
jgi:predicted transcriptional regulator